MRGREAESTPSLLRASEATPEPILSSPHPNSLVDVRTVPRAQEWQWRRQVSACPHGQGDLNEALGPGAGVLGVMQRSPFLIEVTI